MEVVSVEPSLVESHYDAIRALQRDRRADLRAAQRAARDARLRVRRTTITAPPEVVIAARQHYAAAQEAVETAAGELQAVQRELHERSLQRLTDIRIGRV